MLCPSHLIGTFDRYSHLVDICRAHLDHRCRQTFDVVSIHVGGNIA